MVEATKHIIDASTGEIIDGDDPWEQHQRIVGLRQNVEASFLELGRELYTFRAREGWKKLGHGTFNSYLADPEISIGRSTAFCLMAIYEVYQLTLEVRHVGLLAVRDYKKLDLLIPYMTPGNVEEWLDRAATLSRSDLAQAIRDELKPPLPALPDGKYRVFYADPPWKYGDILPPGYGAATHHYQTMTTDELCAMGDQIKEITGNDAVLFLWATSPMLEQALEVMRAWGFAYKTSFVWDKVRHNFGFYNSVRHEILLIGGKGHSTPDSETLHDSVISLERSEKHSEKPEEFRALIDSMYTSGPRIELFARRRVEAWEAWGDEI